MSDSLQALTVVPREVRHLRPYEILVIVDSRPTDEEVAALLAQLGENLKSLGVEVAKIDNWGKRRLAYDIAKQREGTYAVFEASAEPSMVKEFERQLKLNENILRFLSTRVPIRKKARPTKTQETPGGDKPPGDKPIAGDRPAGGDKVLEEVG